jgi:hypothetical protein
MMQGCTVVFGYTVSKVWGKPFSPSTQTMKMPLMPRWWISAQHLKPELRALVARDTSSK